MAERNDFARARSLALKYLTYRDRSQAEMMNYLATKEIPKNVTREIIRYLKNLDYINDDRFALNWGKSRVKNKQLGKHRLQRELLAKGVPREKVSRALQTVYSHVDEFQLAQSCAEKKMRQCENLDAETRNRRIAQFLQRKGFSGQIIFKILNP
ncbi:MAG: regulatory protein RecX [Nitrospinales bacterium]